MKHFNQVGENKAKSFSQEHNDAESTWELTTAVAEPLIIALLSLTLFELQQSS